MKIGIPKEDRHDEKRVGLAPSGVDLLIRKGHTVFIEDNAGEGSHFSNKDYIDIGAKILSTEKEIYKNSDMIIKVSQISEEEAVLFKKNQIVFSFLHLAVSKKSVIKNLLEKKITAIGYELIENGKGLPVLHAMSEIAGPLSVQIAERFLESHNKGKGILLGGITGVAPASVVILGAGVVGSTAAKAALGRGAQVIVIDNDISRLRKIDSSFDKKISTVVANPYTISRGVQYADVLIGAVLIKGEKTPHVVTKEMVKKMKRGSVIVDVSIDQGGCIETSRLTTLSNPVFSIYDVIHYCVPNMPSLVARTASYGLNNSALIYIQNIANEGLSNALLADSGLVNGVCTYNGFCSNESLANIFNLEYRKLHVFSTN